MEDSALEKLRTKAAPVPLPWDTQHTMLVFLPENDFKAAHLAAPPLGTLSPASVLHWVFAWIQRAPSLSCSSPPAVYPSPAEDRLHRGPVCMQTASKEPYRGTEHVSTSHREVFTGRWASSGKVSVWDHAENTVSQEKPREPWYPQTHGSRQGWSTRESASPQKHSGYSRLRSSLRLSALNLPAIFWPFYTHISTVLAGQFCGRSANREAASTLRWVPLGAWARQHCQRAKNTLCKQSLFVPLILFQLSQFSCSI